MCQKVVVSAAAVVVTLNLLKPFSQMAPVASWAAMKNLVSELQEEPVALAADRMSQPHRRPYRNVLAGQTASKATLMPSLLVHAV